MKKISDPEWVSVIIVVFLIFFQVLYSLVQVFHVGAYSKNFCPDLAKKCCVKVVGAVKKPGVYKVYPGVKVSYVIKKAGVHRDADLRGLDDRLVISQDCEIQIPKLENLVIYIQYLDGGEESFCFPLESSSKQIRYILKKDHNIIIPSKIRIRPFMVIKGQKIPKNSSDH